MRTARSLLYRGGGSVQGGLCLGEVSVQGRGLCQGDPPPPRDTCEITLPETSFAGGKNTVRKRKPPI